jgi:hypothetical protein
MERHHRRLLNISYPFVAQVPAATFGANALHLLAGSHGACDEAPTRLVALRGLRDRAGVSRPTRILWREHRGVVPTLDRQGLDADDGFLGVDAALRRGREMLAEYPEGAVLRFLAAAPATGLSIKNAAAVARAAGLCFTPEAVEEALAADTFERRWADARAIFTTCFGALPGDWGYFSIGGLEQLLSGLSIPHVLRRKDYLVAAEWHRGRLRCLDVYSRRLKPLFRHPAE